MKTICLSDAAYKKLKEKMIETGLRPGRRVLEELDKRYGQLRFDNRRVEITKRKTLRVNEDLWANLTFKSLESGVSLARYVEGLLLTEDLLQ